MTDEPGEYDPFERPTEIIAYVYARKGADALRNVLRTTLAKITREDLEDYAGELHEIGLAKAAAIVLEAAQQALPETDLAFCPYMVEPYISSKLNQHNIDAWLGGVKARRERKRRAKLSAPKVSEFIRR